MSANGLSATLPPSSTAHDQREPQAGRAELPKARAAAQMRLQEAAVPPATDPLALLVGQAVEIFSNAGPTRLERDRALETVRNLVRTDTVEFVLRAVKDPANPEPSRLFGALLDARVLPLSQQNSFVGEYCRDRTVDVAKRSMVLTLFTPPWSDHHPASSRAVLRDLAADPHIEPILKCQALSRLTEEALKEREDPKVIARLLRSLAAQAHDPDIAGEALELMGQVGSKADIAFLKRLKLGGVIDRVAVRETIKEIEQRERTGARDLAQDLPYSVRTDKDDLKFPSPTAGLPNVHGTPPDRRQAEELCREVLNGDVLQWTDNAGFNALEEIGKSNPGLIRQSIVTALSNPDKLQQLAQSSDFADRVDRVSAALFPPRTGEEVRLFARLIDTVNGTLERSFGPVHEGHERRLSRLFAALRDSTAPEAAVALRSLFVRYDEAVVALAQKGDRAAVAEAYRRLETPQRCRRPWELFVGLALVDQRPANESIVQALSHGEPGARMRIARLLTEPDNFQRFVELCEKHGAPDYARSLRQAKEFGINNPFRLSSDELATAIKARQEGPRPGEKTAIFVTPKEDWSGAFYPADRLVKQLRCEGYKVMYYEVDGDFSDSRAHFSLERAVVDATTAVDGTIVPCRGAVIGAHGTKQTMSFGGHDPGVFGSYAGPEALDLTDEVRAKRAFTGRFKDAALVLWCCSAGQGENQEGRSNNIANMWRRVLGNQALPKHIYAATERAPIDRLEFLNGELSGVRYIQGDTSAPRYEAAVPSGRGGLA